MNKLTRSLGYAFAALVVLAVLFLAGPRVRASGEYVPLPESVDPIEWVQEQANAHDDIVPLTEDRLILADSTVRTEWSVVYLHGFSGSAAMAHPFVDSLAARLGANAFIPRFTGHGRSGEALGAAMVDDWVQDAADAVSIGTRLGEKVLLVALSNGATFGLWAAMQEEFRERIGAVVLLSPNIRPYDANSELLLWPWGTRLAIAILGEQRSWEPYTEAHGLYSTNEYPTRVLPQMMASVELLRRQDPDNLRAPVLVMYSEQDDVISPEAVREYFERIPTAKRLVDVGNVGDPNNHLIVGDALSPEQTMPTVEEVLRFLDDNTN